MTSGQWVQREIIRVDPHGIKEDCRSIETIAYPEGKRFPVGIYISPLFALIWHAAYPMLELYTLFRELGYPDRAFWGNGGSIVVEVEVAFEIDTFSIFETESIRYAFMSVRVLDGIIL